MCSICRNIPCLTGCPNADPELICEKCGNTIVGQFHDGRRLLCRDCLESMDFDHLLSEFCVELETA